MAGIQTFDETGTLLFGTIDSLARIVLTGQTGGAPTSQVYVPQWEPGAANRAWFTTILYGFAYQSPVPSFYIEVPFLKWLTDPRYAPYGTPDIQYVCGIW